MSQALGPTLVRITKVLVVYGAFAYLLWAMVPSIQRTFLLPQLFRTMAGGGLLVGIVIAVAVAWRYPTLESWGEIDPEVGDELDES